MNYTFSLLILILIGSIIGYLCGSIMFAIYISKLITGQDLTKFGSNNPGYTNSTRLLGKKKSLLVLGLDILKTVLPTIIFFLIYHFWLHQYCAPYKTQFYDPKIWIYIPAIFAIIGHIWPIYHKFKGGKGVASFGGLCICISPFIALIGICFVICIKKITKHASLGSISGAIIVPFLLLIPGINYLYLMYPDITIAFYVAINEIVIIIPLFIILLILSSIVIWRHKDNIKRLLNKEELAS